MDLVRDWYVCRLCGHGFSPVDTALGIEEIGHKVTPEMAARIAYVGQMASSFETRVNALATCWELP